MVERKPMLTLLQNANYPSPSPRARARRRPRIHQDGRRICRGVWARRRDRGVGWGGSGDTFSGGTFSGMDRCCWCVHFVGILLGCGLFFFGLFWFGLARRWWDLVLV